jgi:hypothetical protein
MSRAAEPVGISLDESPFGPVPIAGLPFGKDSEEARAIDRLRAKIDAARAKVGPGEYAYTDDSPFGIPPRD